MSDPFFAERTVVLIPVRPMCLPGYFARPRPGQAGGRVNGPYTWAQPQVRGGSHTDTCAGSKAVDRTYQIAHRARTMLLTRMPVPSLARPDDPTARPERPITVTAE